MKQFLFSVAVIMLSLSLKVSAQSNKCATMDNLEKRYAADPTLKSRMLASEQQISEWIAANSNAKNGSRQSTVTIPVVFHVIWNAAIENVSDSQIQSQLNVMNRDFSFLNTDTLLSTHPFYNLCADTKIEFCLAKRDPLGNATTGITRTQTAIAAWNSNIREDIRSTVKGGKDNWDPTKYLNIYVVNLGAETLGFATFPEDLAASPELDGVFIRYEAFGTVGTAGSGDFSDNSGGRTATHEIGHWLNLRHIWGDTICGNDFVADTEIAVGRNFNCPTFPHRPNSSCGSGANGEMYMNYMDYVDDTCMNMFSKGQAARMNAALNGPRAAILSSNGCQPPTGTNDVQLSNAISISPNPSNGVFRIDISAKNNENYTATILNMLGQTVKELNINDSNTLVDCNDLTSGAYFIKISGQNKSAVKKVFVTR